MLPLNGMAVYYQPYGISLIACQGKNSKKKKLPVEGDVPPPKGFFLLTRIKYLFSITSK